jgi:CheY-like chemotaxis protein
MNVIPNTAESEHNVRRLQPLRVLLSGRDRRFLRVTSFLLAQRGYDVQETSPRKTLESVERHRADVVLLETNDSRTMAARKVAALQALPVAPGLLAVRKWTPIDTLVEEIEAAARSRPAPLTESERVYR